MTAEQLAALLAAVEQVKASAAQIIASVAALKAQIAAQPAPVDATPLVNATADLNALASQLTSSV